MEEITKLYRYVRGDRNFGNIYLEEYKIVKETPKGYRITVHSYGDRLVLKEGRKRFAHETPELALKSFIYRNEKCFKLQEGQVNLTKSFLSTAKKIQESLKTDIIKSVCCECGDKKPIYIANGYCLSCKPF